MTYSSLHIQLRLCRLGQLLYTYWHPHGMTRLMQVKLVQRDLCLSASAFADSQSEVRLLHTSRM
jgi:hypothetical protein